MDEKLKKSNTSSMWRIEDGSENIEEGSLDFCHAPVIENQEKDVLWYSQYFLIEEHVNFIGLDDTQGPYVLSVKLEEGSQSAMFRIILWLAEGPERIVISTKVKTINPQEILKSVKPSLSRKKTKECKSPELIDRLAKLEESMVETKKSFKFGVLFTKKGQTTEEEILGNRTHSQHFDRFLSVMGEKIELKNWIGFDGGLDTDNNRTGKHSLFLEYYGNEIMFHVSTLLPWTENDPQQIERKKHIGNDIVIIVFQEPGSKDEWSPSIISSKFPHIYAVVKPKSIGTYSIKLFIKDCVNKFGPPLPHPPIFTDIDLLRNFLIAKLINGERETIRSAPGFRQNETFQTYLSQIYKEFSRASQKLSPQDTSPRRWSSCIIKSPSPSTQAFQIQTVVTNFPYEITCCDGYASNLIIGTHDGLYMVKMDGQKQFKLETSSYKARHYLQLHVIEDLGILVALVAKLGVIIYDLYSLQDEDGPAEYIVEMSKHTTSITYGVYDDSLFICCIQKTKLLIHKWVDDMFRPYQKIKLPETPRAVEFSNTGQLIIALENEFATIDFYSDTPLLTTLMEFKEYSYVPIDIVFLEENEYLLCFQNIGIFIKKNRAGMKIKWNSIPNYFVYVYPYILVFTSFNIEVRAVLNGALVQIINSESPSAVIKFLTTSNGIFFATNSTTASSACIKQMKIIAQPNGSPLKRFSHSNEILVGHSSPLFRPLTPDSQGKKRSPKPKSRQKQGHSEQS